MRPALLLVDLQNDFLSAAGLEPHPAQLAANAAALLAGFRAADLPVLHTWVTIRRDADTRMPHWRRSGRWDCVEGTPGHAPPPELAPAPGEFVGHRSFYSAFETGELLAELSRRSVDSLCIAGVHTHACVRAAALDAYRYGFAVWIAADAVGSYDPLHADVTRRYLSDRVARWLPTPAILRRVAAEAAEPSGEPPARLPAAVIAGAARIDGAADAVVHRSPRRRDERLWSVPVAGPAIVADAVDAARLAGAEWQTTPLASRIGLCERIAKALGEAGEALARRLAVEVGKPLRDARAEVGFGVALLREAARWAADGATAAGEGWEVRRRPHGVVGTVTPWNNALAIPLGKLAPAILYGNAVVWKPSPPGSGVALELLDIGHRAGLPAGLVAAVLGDHTTAEHLMSHGGVDAVTLTGSSAAGTCAQTICARRRIPLQAELGGNNAAVVWSDCDLDAVATELTDAAFGSAGQRCTANRRVVVDAACFDELLARLRAAAASIAWGDPLDPACRVGPLVSDAAVERVAACVERAKRAGASVFAPQGEGPEATRLRAAGAYYPPTLVWGADPHSEIVQEESFGPVLVLQRAESFEAALDAVNGVSQGLVAALFSESPARRASFLANARAGILKLGSATAGVGASADFGGWKRSGVGPPEHGSGDREFYSRAQTVYG